MNTSLSFNELQDFLEFKYLQYNTPAFLDNDPIQVPHTFSKKQDIEIASFLTATIAWGKRPQIIKSAYRWMQLMDNAPHDFVMNASESELQTLSKFVHRTLNGHDAVFLVLALRRIFTHEGGLEMLCTNVFTEKGDSKHVLIQLRNAILENEWKNRVSKHVSDVANGSAGKRLNLFLMWMVRNDGRGVHFGLWKGISPAALYIPLDVHVGNISRKLGLLTRKANDWQAVMELTEVLRKFDPQDPTKYDFSLFGFGVNEHVKGEKW